MKRGLSTSTSTSTSTSSSSSSASRLSPLAPPFTLNRPPSSSFNTSLDNLETSAYGFYNSTDHSDAATAAFPYDDSWDFQSQYPSSDTFQDNSDFVNKSSQSQNFSTFKDKNAAWDSMPATTFLKQGKPAAERLKNYGEASYNLHGNCNQIMGNGNQIGAKDTEQIDAKCHSLLWAKSGDDSFKFSTSSDLCSISKLQDPQSRPSYPAPVTTYDPKIAPKERCFSQLDSYTAKSPKVSQSSEYNSSVLVSRPSGSSTTLSLLNPALSENVDSSGNDALMEPRVLLNAKDKVVCLDKILMDKGKAGKDDEPATIGAMDPLVKANSKLQVTLKAPGAEAGVPAGSSSVLCDYSDSDLDSPCWKGTQVYQATSGVSEPVSVQLIKNEAEVSNSLNPLAPQFYPGSTKLNINYHETECDGDDSSSFWKTASSAVASSAREHGLIDSLKAGTCPSEVSNGTGTQCSKHFHEPEKGAAHGSNRSSLLSSFCSIQPYLVEDYYTSNCQLVTRSKNAGSLSVKNAAPNSSTSLSSLVTENVMKSSSSRVGVSSEFTKTLYDASNSAPPKADIQSVVNTIHDLSKLLIQNCSNDLDSLNEHEHEIIEHIINNLHMCIRNKGRQRAPIPESSNLCTSYNLRKSADCQKQSNMEFQVTRMKTMTIPHGQESLKRSSTMSCEKVLESFSPNSGEVIERGNGITQMQVIEESLKENHQIEGEMHTQALLYRNLWLEAEAALCCMKYKAGQLLIRQKIRVDDSSLAGRDGGEATSRVCLRLSEAHKLW